MYLNNLLAWTPLESWPIYWLTYNNVPKCVFKLKCRFEKVNKTHEIINKKMAPPKSTPT